MKVNVSAATACIQFPLVTVSEPNVRGHWAKRAKRAANQRDVVGWELAAWRGSIAAAMRLVGQPCLVRLTRLGPKTLDDDNLRGALKAVRDAVAQSVGIDDGSDRIKWDYAQAEQREHAVRIEIERVTQSTNEQGA